jgi:hypothetical protein
MTPHGFIDDLDEAEYHAHPTSLSVSGAKVLLKAPALFEWQRTHPVHRDVFDIGSAAHRLVLGVGPDVLVCPFDNWATKDAKAMREDARTKGEIPVLTKDWERVTAMAGALSSHALAMKLLSDGKPEVSAFCPDEETGVLRRARFDWLGPHVVTDYKTAASVNPVDLAGRYGAVKKWGYDQQAAWYLDIARDLGHPAQAFAFIFQMKEPPYLVTVAQVHEDDLWDARQRNRAALERFRDCTESGFWPGFVPDNSFVTVSLDDQTFQEESA